MASFQKIIIPRLIRKRILQNYPERPPVIAHRGGGGLAPENTLAAFRNAAGLGVDGIEFDVQRSKDGYLVVFHDPDVKRATNGRGMIKDLTLAQINELDAGIKFGRGFSGERVPALKSALEFLAPLSLQLIIELKHPEYYPGIEKQVLDMIDSFGMKSRVKIASFCAGSLSRVHELDRTVPLVRNYRVNLPLINEKYDAASVNYLNLRLFPWRIKDYRKHCREVMVWKADKLCDMIFFLRKGIDAVITDYPDRMIRLPGLDLQGIITNIGCFDKHAASFGTVINLVLLLYCLRRVFGLK